MTNAEKQGEGCLWWRVYWSDWTGQRWRMSIVSGYWSDDKSKVKVICGEESTGLTGQDKGKGCLWWVATDLTTQAGWRLSVVERVPVWLDRTKVKVLYSEWLLIWQQEQGEGCLWWSSTDLIGQDKGEGCLWWMATDLMTRAGWRLFVVERVLIWLDRTKVKVVYSEWLLIWQQEQDDGCLWWREYWTDWTGQRWRQSMVSGYWPDDSSRVKVVCGEERTDLTWQDKSEGCLRWLATDLTTRLSVVGRVLIWLNRRKVKVVYGGMATEQDGCLLIWLDGTRVKIVCGGEVTDLIVQDKGENCLRWRGYWSDWIGQRQKLFCSGEANNLTGRTWVKAVLSGETTDLTG